MGIERRLARPGFNYGPPARQGTGKLDIDARRVKRHCVSIDQCDGRTGIVDRHVQVVQGSQDGNPELARATVERQNTREMSEDEAAAYRLAPEHMLDWLGASAMPDDAADLKVLERWENHLDWLELDQRQPASPAEDGVWHEPERSRK